jgi:hypothetical protein
MPLSLLRLVRKLFNPLLLAHRTLCRTSDAIPVFLSLPAAATGASWRLFRIGQRGWGSTALAPQSPCRRPWRWPLQALANHPALLHLGGLFQRASTVTGFAWLTTPSARALSARRHLHCQTTDHQ